MGAHHFKICLVPADASVERDADGNYAGNFLASCPISNALCERFRNIFTKANHWGDVEEYVSNNEWGSDLRIWRSKDGEIEDITFRFAASSDPIEKLQAFIKIAKGAGCFLLLEASGKVVAPEFDTLLEILRTHHSYRFGADPNGTVVEASKKIKEEGK
jgi:hypothetical protein